MEGALRSGERAAQEVLQPPCDEISGAAPGV